MNQLRTNTVSGRVALYRAPLVSVAAALAAGIAMGRFAPLPSGFWVFFGAAALAVAAGTFRRKHLHLLTACAVASAVFAIGAVNVRLAYFTVPDDHIVTYTGTSSMLASLHGRIVTSPQIIEDDPGVTLGYRRPPRTSFILQSSAIRTDTGYRPVSGLVRVSIEQPDDRLAAGQEVLLVGRIGRYGPPANPGQHDSAGAARQRYTMTWMTVPGADGATIISGEKLPWYARILWRVRAGAREHLSRCGDGLSGKLLNALIIGERHPALRTLSRTMVKAGIAHFLSISGLHLGVFLGFVYLLCRLITATPRRAAGIVLVVLAAYMLLAEPRAPLLRSAIMAAAMCLAAMSRRRHTALNALAVAAVILLMIDPLQIFAAGFQLSFTVVAGLIVLRPPVRDLVFGRWLRRRGLMVFRTDQRVPRWVYYTAGNWLIDGVTMVLTAHLVATPLVAYHFGLVSPYAPLLSLLVFPLVVAILVPGYVSMGLAWVTPNLSYAVGRLAGSAAEALSWAVNATSQLPGLNFQLRPVGIFWVLLCYGALGCVLISRRIRFGRALAAGSILVLLGATAYTQRAAPAPKLAELNVLSVGAGQCAILRTPAGRTYIFDAGTRSNFDAYQRVLGPFLRHQRLRTPSVAFISHANTDHYNALVGLLEEGRLDRVYLNDYFGRGPYRDDYQPIPEEMQLLGELIGRDVELLRLRAGVKISLDSRTAVEVLWPPADRRSDLTVNDTSLVLRITCDGRSVLLTGDLDELGQSALAAAGSAIAADVLVMPHHGGWEKSLPELLRAVGPSVVLVSNSFEPRCPVRGGEEAAALYGRMRTAYRYYSTPRNGWIQVRFGAGKIDVKTMH